MKKIVTIIGARPQIIKASAISRVIQTTFKEQLSEVIVHTGQHYDANMSQIFFDELNIPAPNYNLNVGSGNHGNQTALMITGIEEILLNEKPNALIVYGDTNSTLAGSIAASKMQIPIIHIEAGLRSFNKAMPEEINRIMCDHVSTLLFSPTQTGINNLINEGFKANTSAPYTFNNPNIIHSGDIMYDNSLYFSTVSDKQSTILNKLSITNSDFILCTIHRDINTDDKQRLTNIFDALNEISVQQSIKIVIPLHPRTKKLLQKNVDGSILEKVLNNENIIIIEPVAFLDMIALEKNAKLILTDSGGVQKEAYFFNKPSVILRPETEWIELVENGNAVIADADKENIISSALNFLTSSNKLSFPSLYGNGNAAQFICQEIINL